MKTFIGGKDVFTLLPTGFGKSLKKPSTSFKITGKWFIKSHARMFYKDPPSEIHLLSRSPRSLCEADSELQDLAKVRLTLRRNFSF